ncbi:hypothetical protein [Telmatospirillum sp.]|uniref:hypothetical protein n=1 Tax=Telmatospirillum sp. TaxID=2079197 RepID=UPI002840629C|nr:hypothetical protein [Telmatospirillum sp.]MDR3440538.1 hypothetical protein [Telmatospirillum sp.]
MTTMEGAIRSALLSLTQTGAADVAASARKTAITALLAIVAAVLATASAGCAVAALWIYAAPLIGPATAMLAVAFCLLILCLAVVFLASLVARTARRPRPAVSPEVLLAEAARLLKDQKGTMLVAALVAGMLVGNDSRKQ